MSPSPHLWFCMQNTDFRIRTTSLYGSQTVPVDLWMKNSVLRSRMTFVYWSQPSSAVLYIQNRDFSIRITSLYWSQPSSSVLCKQNNVISIRIISLYGTQPSFVVFACIIANLEPLLQVSMGPSPYLWFYAFTTATLWPELIVPDLTCRFVNAKQRE